MYLPDYFRATEAEVAALLRRPPVVDLITATARGLMATLMPMVWDEPGSREDVGPFGSLLGHISIKNDQWRESPIGQAMAIVRGPDTYVTPSWYPTKREHGRVVPTWNYIIIRAHGDLIVHRDVTWLEANVRRLVELHEGARPEPWSVDDAPEAYIDGQLRAIVGLELSIERLEGKWKLSQNRSDADIDGVIAGLNAEGGHPLATTMRAR